MSPCVILRWQTVQGESMTECTDFPVIFCTWHARQSLSTSPGCSAAQLAGTPHSKVQVITRKSRWLYVFPVMVVASWYATPDIESVMRMNYMRSNQLTIRCPRSL
jgi:hypothetical protein